MIQLSKIDTSGHMQGDRAEGDQGVVGIAVRIWSSSESTTVEIWQQGPETPAAGTLVAFERYARHTNGRPDVKVLAGWLARKVSDMDRRGWEEIR